MRVFLTLILALSATAACSKGGDRRKACEHMIDLAKADIEKNIAQMGPGMEKFADKLRDQVKTSTDSDLETCEKKMAEKDIEPSCILDADSIDEAARCLRK